LTLGGVNPDYYEGEMKYHKLVSETYWLIDVDEVRVGKSALKNIKGVVDTGTSVIVAPKHMIAELTKEIPAKPDCQNLDQYPNIEFTIDGTNYSLTPR